MLDPRWIPGPCTLEHGISANDICALRDLHGQETTELDAVALAPGGPVYRLICQMSLL